MKKLYILLLLGMLGVVATTVPALARENETELAKKLANPVADLISVPFQFNYDKNIGPTEDGSQWRLNIQPVIPFSISESWNLVTRTIVPLIDQNDIPVSGQGESGFGDILASQFLSPKKPTKRGWIWGAGPVWLIPSASDAALGSDKWGLGPTAVILKQAGPWSYGALVNHVWSFAGDNDRPDVNATYLQPFLSYVTQTMTTVSINTESTYDWEAEQWSVPINLLVSQMVKIGKLPVQFGVGARYWTESPDNGPDGWGLRAQVTFLFPR